jgi:nucleotide-binding universal stress UspA family protein
MLADPHEAPVVVAVADIDPVDDAVEWAAAEAAARATRLVVVHVVAPVPVWDVGGLALLTVELPDDGPAAGEVLASAVRRAGAVAGELAVSGELLCGTPAGALVARSRGAGLLVLGGRGTDVRARRTGALAGKVAARAHCPVAVVRSRPRGPAGPAGPRVVVGVDPAHCAPDPVEFAFRSSARRGVPLVAVHAWDTDAPADLEGACGPAEAGEAKVRDDLDRVLGPWRRRFVDVPVEAHLLRGDPVAALLAASRGAALVVVGSRGRRGPLRGLSRSVGSALVQRADCPTVVVRPDQVTGARRPPSGAGTAGSRRRGRSSAGG